MSVRVLDDGPGLDPDEAASLFDLYYRSESTRSAPGSGIGLFVCRELVTAMGGRIWAQPRPEGGAEFGFTLPVWADEPMTEPEEPQPARTRASVAQDVLPVT